MIGEKIKKARLSKEMTQEELATELLVSRSTISSWEVGRSFPDLEMIVRLSDYFGESLDSLIREEAQMVKELSYSTSQKKFNRGLIVLLISLLVIIFSNIFAVLWTFDHPISLTSKNSNLSQFKLTQVTDELEQDWDTELDFDVTSRKWWLSPQTNTAQFFYSDNNLYITLKGNYNPLYFFYNEKISTGNSFKRAERVNSPTKVYLTEEVMNPTEENTSWQPSGEITYLGELEQLIK